MTKQLKTLSYIAIVALFVAMPMLSKTAYVIHLSVIALIFVISATGLNIIQGLAGYVSIAQAAFMGVGAYASAILSMKTGLPVWSSIILAPLITAAIAALVGFPALRVKGHYFAIVTLAYGMVFFVVALNWTHFTGGEAGLQNIPMVESIPLPNGEEIRFLRVNYFYMTLAVTVLAIVVSSYVMHSRLGRIFGMIRQDEGLAEASGIACHFYKIVAFSLSAGFAGLAGALYAHYIGYINPAPFSVAVSMNIILAVILGGSGTLMGPAVGAFVVTFLPEYLRVDETFRMIAYGFILIVVTIWLPRGLLSLLRRLVTRVTGRENGVSAQASARPSGS